ncbi:MAG: tetratricopeptide repeat protein [Chloroflexi bacterium]|nr:tetratricopeptide repeat protein [Chloroflexota bacterium]
MSEIPRFITKILVPPRHPNILRRPRLIDFLHQYGDRRLIIISAPAGYGKTTMLIDFAHEVELPVCWYSLESADQDPKVFLEYLIASLAQRFPSFGQRMRSFLREVSDVSREMNSAIGLLVSEIQTAIPEYFFLILDDYQNVDASEEVNTALDLLLYYLPENCHIILATRTLPKLTLSRLAAYRQVAGLGISDLRFTAEEIRELLSQNYKIILPPKAAEELASHSEGWITGIILTTHNMWQGLFESLIRAKGAGGPIFDYLAAEVYARQSEEVRQFLLGSAVLPQMKASRCDDLLGSADSQRILEYLEENNLFIIRLEGDWYRYHHLFQEFLEEKLRREDEERFVSLHLKAAGMAREGKEWEQAVQHYLRADRPAAAAELLAAVSEEMVNAGKWETLLRLSALLPEESLSHCPHLLLQWGRACIYRDELDTANELFERAYACFAAVADKVNMARSLALKSSVLLSKRQYAASIAECQKALSMVPEGAPVVLAQAYKNMGMSHSALGRFSEGIEDLKRSLDLYAEDGDLFNLAAVQEALGVANARQGDLSEAIAYHRQALHSWEKLGNAGARALALNNLGVLYHHQGHHSRAQALLENALTIAEEAGYLRVAGLALSSLGDVQRDLGQYQGARQTYERALELARRLDDPFLITYCLDALGNTHRLLGDYAEAEQLFQQSWQIAQEQGSDYELGLLTISLGTLLYERGERQVAIERLTEATELLARSGAKRELARARFHLAQSLFLDQQLDASIEQLRETLDMVSQLGYDAFLVAEGRRAGPMLRYAAARGVDGGRLTSLLRRIEAGQPPAAESRPLKPPLGVALKTVPRIESYAFGEARVLLNGELVNNLRWRIERAKELFFFLLAHPRPLRREQVMAALWPDLRESKGSINFHSTLYRLRQALYPGVVLLQEGRYRLDPEGDLWSDVAEFESLINEAGSLPKEDDRRVALYERACALYRGPYLEEFYSEWCSTRREELEEEYLRALAELAAHYGCKGAYEQSIALCRRILAVDDYREEAHADLMRYYALSGDRPAALRHYQRYVRFLAKELKTRPSPPLQALYEELQR